MGQPLLLPPELNESVTRIRTTDAGTLRRAAAALDATARTAGSVSRSLGGRTAVAGRVARPRRRRLPGVRGHGPRPARSGPHRAGSDRERAALPRRGWPTTRTPRRTWGSTSPPPFHPATLGSTDSPWTDAQQRRNDVLRLLHRAAATFQASERATRAVLWSLGEQAPYGIPLPELPPPAPQSWWQTALIGPADVQYWTAANGLRVNVDDDGSGPPGRRHVALRPCCPALRRGRGRQPRPGVHGRPVGRHRRAAGERAVRRGDARLHRPRSQGGTHRRGGDQRHVRTDPAVARMAP